MAATKVIATVRGKDIKYGMFPIKSGETFKSGDYLVLTSTGASLPVAAGNDYANPSSNAARILGQAVGDALDDAGNVNPYIMVAVARPGTEFMMPLYSATPASAVPIITQIGSDYRLRNSTTYGGTVDLDTTSTPHVRVTDFDPTDLPTWPGAYTSGTTQYANVWVEFIAGACLLTGAR